MKFEEYSKFVDLVTSQESKDLKCLIERLKLLNNDTNICRLITAGFGLSSESGEITEIIKKVILQGKPLDDETKHHLKREAGDVVWYLAQLLMALDLSFDEVIEENIRKLEARYPGGFEVARSEVRDEGDL